MKPQWNVWLLVAGMGVGLSGCGQPEPTIPAGLAGLPEADRVAAMGQGKCPVSREDLGSKGAPVKIEVQGKTVFLCCPNCEDPIRKEPEKYLSLATE